jgi:hypothetical protein
MNDETRDDGAHETGTAARAGAGGVSRRGFLGGLGALGAAGTTAAAVAGAGTVVLQPWLNPAAEAQSAPAEPPEGAKLSPRAVRRYAALHNRVNAARAEFAIPLESQIANGDEQRYANQIGNFHKALPHNGFGEVDPGAYALLLRAASSGDPADFEAIPLGGTVKLTDPQSGLAFDLQGCDGPALAIPPAPALASAEEAGEMVELYWAALLRDVSFADYPTSPDAAAAAAGLNALSDFRGPRQGGQVTPQTLFRDDLPGATTGPYLSQFMLLPTPFGAEFVQRMMRTYLPATDQLTSFADWLAVQDGGPAPGKEHFDPQRRFIRNARDLSAWVHRDVLFQAYFNACLILITPPSSADPESGGIGCRLNPGNPYNSSRNQTGFGTFGPPGIKGLMCEVATRGLKSTWHKKWFVHRRLRPEEFGGLVHLQKTANRYPGTLHVDVLDAPVLGRVEARFGSFLHPQSFPEGCPTHPSYSAGHATVAGACVTILKAVFDETVAIENPVVPDADGLSLVPWTGSATLTVGGELNKLASNVATGRNLAGVHWRSDAIESMKLGEAIAISILRDQRLTYNESRGGFFNGFTFTRFDGTQITV